MEYIDSDYNETDSDELDEDIENELYSVLHYNVLSEDIPPKLLEKYDIKRTEKNEFLISLKKDKKESFEESKEKAEENTPIENSTIDIISAEKTTLENVIAEKTLENTTSEPNNTSNVDPSQSFIIISDDDSDSDVVLNEPILEVTYVSSPSVIEVDSLSSSDMEDDLMLNIGDRTNLSSIFPVDDSEEEIVKVKWKEVVSPGSWTNEMKKYYNKPCERLKNFDYEKIRDEIKGTGNWHINLADRLPSKRKVKRCTICRQTDHQRKNCPRRFVNCYMCGNSGHNDSNCPSKKCLNCGKRSKVYIAMCQRCKDSRYETCSECKQKGHSKEVCPDTWRRYHATTKGKLVVKEETVNERLMCCNCAQSGHLFENCPKIYWSVYPPTSFLIKKTEEPLCKSPKGKRFQCQEDETDFVRTPKKPRLNQKYSNKSPRGPNWNRGSFNRASTQYKGRNPATFDQNHTPFNRNSAPFDQSAFSFLRNPAPFNNPSTPFNQRSMPLDPRSMQFNLSTPFSQKSMPFNQNANQFSKRSTPSNEASTSSKHSKSSTPRRKNKIRYFHNNVNSPNQSKSPKLKKKKKKKKNTPQ